MIKVPLALATALASLALATTPCLAQSAQLDPSIWQVGTTLWDDDDLPDLFMVKKRPSGTGTTEVHIHAGSSQYQTPLVEVGTPLPYTDADWTFAMADYDLDGVPDLWAIDRDGPGHRVEVQILSGAMFFRQFLLRSVTSLDAVGPEADFLAIPPIWAAGTRPNLLMVLRGGTESKTIEVRVLSGASGFRQVVLESTTPLPATGTGATWQFQAGDFDGDRVLDLIAVTSEAGGAVYVVSGKSDLKRYAFQRQLTDDGAETALKERSPHLASCEAPLLTKLEQVAADPLVPAGVGPRTALMSGTTVAPALADLFSAVSVSQAIRRFQKAPADPDRLRDEPRDRKVSTLLELVDVVKP